MKRFLVKVATASAFALAGLLGLIATVAIPAHATTRYTANNGVDSGSCGSHTSPCRSITQAITNASAGDTIQVGPGVYGDLNRDGTMGNSPGEEVASGGAMITVSKQLTIVSRDGAGATVLDAGFIGTCVFGSTPGAACVGDASCFATSTCSGGGFCSPSLSTVLISAAGVKFGKVNHGFTMRRAADGLDIGATTTATGNIAESTCGSGFSVYSGVSGVLLTGNAAINSSSTGFLDKGTGTVLKGNLARGTGLGIDVISPSGATTYTKNVLIGNLVGLEIEEQAPSGNATLIVSHNAVVGNSSDGIFILMFGTFSSDVSASLDHNDYFDNGGVSNCGMGALINDSNGHTLTITSTSDFWGAASGPGPDPADTKGGACNTIVSGSITENVVTPSASEIVVKPPSIK